MESVLRHIRNETDMDLLFRGHSIVGPVVTVYDYLQYLTCAKFVTPLITERLGRLNEEKAPLLDGKPPPVSPWAARAVYAPGADTASACR